MAVGMQEDAEDAAVEEGGVFEVEDDPRAAAIQQREEVVLHSRSHVDIAFTHKTDLRRPFYEHRVHPPYFLSGARLHEGTPPRAPSDDENPGASPLCMKPVEFLQ